MLFAFVCNDSRFAKVLKVVTDLQDTSSKNMPLELQLDQLSRQVQNQGLQGRGWVVWAVSVGFIFWHGC